ncbi:uncharacterized protein LOC129218032 isoform X2 [Uloborus diversus]|nr:uncharacterized protein LOC129218032 isoform X2 [Uloborus diversus]
MIAKDSTHQFTAKEVQEHYLKQYVNGPLGGLGLDGDDFVPYHLDLEFKVPFDTVKSLLTSDTTVSSDMQDGEFKEIGYNPYRNEFREEFDPRAENIIQHLTSISDFNTAADDVHLPFIRYYCDRIFMRSEINDFLKNHKLPEHYFKNGRSLMEYVRKRKREKDFVKRDDFEELKKWMRYSYLFPKSDDYYSFLCGFLKERLLKKKIREVNQKMRRKCYKDGMKCKKISKSYKKIHAVRERSNKSFVKKSKTKGLKSKLHDTLLKLEEQLHKKDVQKLRKNKGKRHKEMKAEDIERKINVNSQGKELQEKDFKKITAKKGKSPFTKPKERQKVDKAKEHLDFHLKVQRQGKKKAEQDLYENRETKKPKANTNVTNLISDLNKAIVRLLPEKELEQNNRKESPKTGNIAIKSRGIPDGMSTKLDVQHKRRKKKTRSKLVNVFEMLSEAESSSNSSDEFYHRVSLEDEIEVSKDGPQKAKRKFGVLTCEAYDSLSREEKELCHKLCLLPIYYIAYKIILVAADEEKLNGSNMNPSCLYPSDLPQYYCDQIFDFMSACGWIRSKGLMEVARRNKFNLTASSNLLMSSEVPKTKTAFQKNGGEYLPGRRRRSALKRSAASKWSVSNHKVLPRALQRKDKRKR